MARTHIYGRIALAAVLLGSVALQAAEVRGVIADARGGEPLARVRVRLVGTSRQTITDAAGAFALADVPAGQYTLGVETVGYRMVKTDFALAADEVKEVSVGLVPETLRRTDSVDVKADLFEVSPSASPAATNLVGNELQNLSTVLAHDPLRAVQALPGVAPSGNNDLFAEFSVDGAPFSEVGMYVDGVLVHQPFHELPGLRDGASMTAISSENVEELTLSPVAFGSQYGDRIGAALDLRTREGSRTAPLFRASAGLADSSFVAEGPLSRLHRGSWLFSMRKSYLRFMTQRVSSDPSLDVGFYDTESKVAYDLTPKQSMSVYFLDGHTDLDRSEYRDQIGLNSVMLGSSHLTLSNLAWRGDPNQHLLLNANFAYMHERSETHNPFGNRLGSDTYAEWTGGANATWFWTAKGSLDAGWTTRRLADSGYSAFYNYANYTPRPFDNGAGSAVRHGAYAQQNWSAMNGRVRATAGVRWDRMPEPRVAGVNPAGAVASYVSTGVVSPHAAASVQVRANTQLQFSWGEYAQFPELHLLLIPDGGTRLQPERAIHYLAAVEQRLGTHTRVRVEAYEREERDIIGRPLLDPRLVNGAVVFPSANPFFNNSAVPLSPQPLFYNSLRGYARGVQFTIQRRSANRLAGWISYTLGYARQRDLLLRQSFTSPDDQRHTLNVYGTYRVSPSVNVSSKWTFGSGFPLEGYFRQAGSNYFLASERNQLRLGDYQRLDLRINKSISYDKWKLTFYGEVLNATNHDNRRFTGFNAVNLRSAAAYPNIDRTAPLLPAAGVTVEF